MRARVLGASLVFLIAPAVARAITINEGPFVGDFGDTFASRTVLPAQTDLIDWGSVFNHYDDFPEPTWDDDFFSFIDLVPGSVFTLTVEILSSSPIGFRGFDASGGVVVPLFSPVGEQGSSPPTVRTGIVPVSGELVMEVFAGDEGVAYILGIDAPRVVVPEPATAALLMLGLAGLARARRRAR